MSLKKIKITFFEKFAIRNNRVMGNYWWVVPMHLDDPEIASPLEVFEFFEQEYKKLENRLKKKIKRNKQAVSGVR